MIKLKHTTVEDVDLLLKMDKQPSTQKYLGGVKNKTKDERISFLTKKELNKNAYTVLLENNLIGFVELKANDAGGEISYIFDCEYWGNGYATIAINQLIDISFNELNLDFVSAYTLSDNIASKRVLEKNKFIYVGTIIKNDCEFLKYIVINNFDVKFSLSEKRSVVIVDGVEIAECNFNIIDNKWNIIHTFVNDSYRGLGIARKLVECVVDNAKKYGIDVIADCSYAKKILNDYEKE